jgi:hypothetical protein
MAEKQLKTLKFYGLDDVYVVPSMYGVDTNKDGNVEICFGMPTSNLISFSLEDGYGVNGIFNGFGDKLTFQAEPGMTWEQWIYSDYCTIQDYAETAGPDLWICGYFVRLRDFTQVMPSDEIIPNYVYVVSA